LYAVIILYICLSVTIVVCTKTTKHIKVSDGLSNSTITDNLMYETFTILLAIVVALDYNYSEIVACSGSNALADKHGFCFKCDCRFEGLLNVTGGHVYTYSMW